MNGASGLRGMFQRWIDDLKAGAGATVRLSALAVAAGAALAVALAFLCAAGFVYVSQTYGPVYACLSGAGLFLVVMLIVLAIHGEQKRRAEARRAEAAKRAASQSFLTDPVLLATGLRVVQAIGVKRLLPVIVIGGVALGLMAAARRDTPPDDAGDS